MSVRFRNGGIETDNGFAPTGGEANLTPAQGVTLNTAYPDALDGAVVLDPNKDLFVIRAATYPVGTDGQIWIGGFAPGKAGQKAAIIREPGAANVFIQAFDDGDVVAQVPAANRVYGTVGFQGVNAFGIVNLVYSGSLARWLITGHQGS